MKKFTKVLACVVAVMLTMLMLTACGGISDAGKAKERLEKNAYKVDVIEGEGLSGAAETFAGLEKILTAKKDTPATKDKPAKKHILTIMYFKDSDSTKKAYDATRKTYDDAKKAYDDTMKTYNDAKKAYDALSPEEKENQEEPQKPEEWYELSIKYSAEALVTGDRESVDLVRN